MRRHYASNLKAFSRKLRSTIGLKILRFTNIDVMKNIASVIEKIVDELK